DREIPDGLQQPEDVLKELLSSLEERISELEKLGSQASAGNTAKRASALRARFLSLSKNATDLKGPKLEKITSELTDLYEKVTAELTVPIRETGVAKALSTLQSRQDASSRSKVAGFAKRRESIANEDDPKKRCDLYFQLERDIIKSD